MSTPSQEKPQPPVDDSDIDPQTIPAGGKYFFPEPAPRSGEDTAPKTPFRLGNG
jgi:hypothetical protein